MACVCPANNRAIARFKRSEDDVGRSGLQKIDAQHAILKVQVPKTWIGKSVGELDIRRKFGINILDIKRARETDVSVTPDTILSDDITILALGEYKSLQKCFRI